MDELLSATTQRDASTRWAAVTILQSFCQQTKLDYSEYVPQLFRGLLHVFTQTETFVLEAAWSCLQAVTKVVRFLEPEILLISEKIYTFVTMLNCF